MVVRPGETGTNLRQLSLALYFSAPRRVSRAFCKLQSIADALCLPQSQSTFPLRGPFAGIYSLPRQDLSSIPAYFGSGKRSTRLFAWSASTAKFVNVWIAAEKRDVPPIPSVALVLNVWGSTIEMELLSAFTVSIVPVWKLYARAVGLIPTLIGTVWFVSD